MRRGFLRLIDSLVNLIIIIYFALSVCLFPRTVVASCLKETIRAVTLWMGTSFARPATLLGSRL